MTADLTVKKAQAEFVIIAGIALLAVVVVYFAYSGDFTPTNLPSGVYQRQQAVQQSVLSVAGKGADEALRIMEAHGGYPTAELLGNGTYQVPPFVIFMNEGIPYWTRCEQITAPSRENVTRWFELSVERYIKDHITEIQDTYRKDNLTFDLSRLSVSAKILSNPHKIEMTVNLPTRVQGYSMVSQLYPYKVSKDTKLGEILDFADNFSSSQAKKRFLEVFTEASIYMSADAKDGQPRLPTGGFLTSCGETIYRTPQQISGYLKEIAEYVVTQTLWWQNMTVDKSKPKVYAINKDILGTEYKDLDIRMYLPDDFSFNTTRGIVITNNEPAYTSSIWTASDCIGVYNMGYIISYPVVMRVKDSLSGYSFNFATLVFVDRDNKKGMFPGKCQDIAQGQDACRDMGCSAKIRITDGSSPLAGAVATFGECGLGTSDASGNIEGKIKCGEYELSIFKDSGYDFYGANVSSSSMNGTYTLRSIANLTFYFRKVAITEQPAYTKCVIDASADYAFAGLYSEKQFTISNIDPKGIKENCLSGCSQCNNTEMNMQDVNACKDCLSQCVTGAVIDGVNVNYIPSGSYLVNVTQFGHDMTIMSGGLISSYGLNSSNPIVYLYAPIDSTSSMSKPFMESKKPALTQKLGACQISPVSGTAYQRITYAIPCGSCESLQSAWVQIKPDCTNINLNGMFCSCESGSSSCDTPCTAEMCGVCCTTSIQNIVSEFQKCNNARVICK